MHCLFARFPIPLALITSRGGHSDLPVAPRPAPPHSLLSFIAPPARLRPRFFSAELSFNPAQLPSFLPTNLVCWALFAAAAGSLALAQLPQNPSHPRDPVDWIARFLLVVHPDPGASAAGFSSPPYLLPYVYLCMSFAFTVVAGMPVLVSVIVSDARRDFLPAFRPSFCADSCQIHDSPKPVFFFF